MEVYEARIKEIKPVTGDIVSFYLEIPAGVRWEAGAHMHVGLPGFQNGELTDKELVRHMSIVTRPEDQVIGFTTRIPENASRFKHALSKMCVGDILYLFKIRSIMKLQAEGIPMVVLSMGVGITSVYPLILQYREESGKKNLTSLHVSKPEEHLYREILEKNKAEGICLLWADSRNAYQEELEKILASLRDVPGAVFYIVGSDQYLQDMIKVLHQKGITDVQIIIDKKEEKRLAFFETLL